jgi:hypothetical protein
VHSSEQYLNHYLKESWGFEGFAVTDWNDIEKLVYFHHVAADNKEVPPNRTPDELLLSTPFRSCWLTLSPTHAGHQDGPLGWRRHEHGPFGTNKKSKNAPSYYVILM